MKITWVGFSTKLKVKTLILFFFITITYVFLFAALLDFIETSKIVINKQDQLISELEYKLLICRMNAINEIRDKGEIKVEENNLYLDPPIKKPMELRKSD